MLPNLRDLHLLRWGGLQPSPLKFDEEAPTPTGHDEQPVRDAALAGAGELVDQTAEGPGVGADSFLDVFFEGVGVHPSKSLKASRSLRAPNKAL